MRIVSVQKNDHDSYSYSSDRLVRLSDSVDLQRCSHSSGNSVLLSFADSFIYNPGTGVTAERGDATAALGAPEGPFPATASAPINFVSLGRNSGELILAFNTNGSFFRG